MNLNQLNNNFFTPEGYNEKNRIVNQKNRIDEIIKNKEIVSGKVIAYKNETNPYLVVDLGDGDIGLYYVENQPIYKMKSLVNEIIEFFIVENLSEKEYLLERNSIIEEKRKEILKQYKVGDIVLGKKVSVLAYGVFVDIGCGVTGLLHKNFIKGKPNHPNEVLKNESFFYVEIIRISDEGIFLKMI